MKDISKYITIKGNYFDTFIYKGYLFLITLDKEFVVLDWNKVVRQIIPTNNHLGYLCAFTNSNYLYEKHFHTMFNDEEIKKVIVGRFDEIENALIEEASVFKAKESFFLDYLPNDLGVYNDYLYYCNSHGLFRTKLRISNAKEKKLKKIFSTVEVLVNNQGIVAIDVQKYGNIYMSSLDDGLYEFNLFEYTMEYETFVHRLTDSHSSFSRANGISTLNGSYYGSSVFLERIWEEQKTSNDEKKVYPSEIKKEYDLAELFRENGFFISSDEKIYLLNENGIKMMVYQNSDEIGKCFIPNDDGDLISIVSNDPVSPDSIISASVEFFGVVIEYKNKIQVLLSSKRIFEKQFDNKNKFVGWRTFPRSIDYTNQLHIIFEDRLEIHSFNDDYFLSQDGKLLGSMANKKYYKRKPKANS